MKPAAGNKVAITMAFFLLVSIKIILFNIVLSSETIGPQALSDELIYRLNSESIFNMGKYYNDHYPPFYPLLLSVAFFLKNNWYQGMFFMNAVLSSLVLVPLWFISLRYLSQEASMTVLFISSLSTFHFFYPGLIMSENLHVPIFIFSLYLLFESGSGTGLKKRMVSTFLGIMMALGYMTKYIYLTAIPVLVLLWCIKPIFNDSPEERKILVPSRIVDLLLMAAGFTVAFLPWFVYKYYSGFGLGGGLGAEFVLKGMPESADLKSLVLWSGFYVSYSILAFAPFLLVFLLFLFIRSSYRITINRKETFFIFTVLLLSAVFLITAVQHSWRAGYNYPLPKRINGRYLMHLMPIWVVVFMIAIDKVKNVAARLQVSRIVYATLLCLVLLFFSLVLLRSDIAPWSYDFIDTTDGLFYRSGLSSILFGIIFTIMVVALLACSCNRLKTKHFVLIFSALALVIQADSAFTSYRFMVSHRTDYQLHGRALSSFIAEESGNNHEDIVIMSDLPELTGKSGLRLQQSLGFWVPPSISKPSIKFISLSDYLSDEGYGNSKLYSITTALIGNPIYNYMVNGKNYYVYDITTVWPGKIIGRVPPIKPFKTGREEAGSL